jgi:AcrR family transcriptional regulator
MENGHLGKAHWLRAARLALLHGGPAGVRIEQLARDLKVTKGSFYWHFRDRKDLLEALLREWEDETSSMFAETAAHGSIRDGLQWLMEEVGRRVVASERGDMPSDAAMFGWAATAPDVAKRVNRVERERIEFLTRVAGSADRAQFVYLAYVGFLMRRRRVRGLNDVFPVVAAQMLALILPPSAPEPKQSRRSTG